MENIPEENQSECCTVVVVTHSVTTDLGTYGSTGSRWMPSLQKMTWTTKNKKVLFLFFSSPQQKETKHRAEVLFYSEKRVQNWVP